MQNRVITLLNRLEPGCAEACDCGGGSCAVVVAEHDDVVVNFDVMGSVLDVDSTDLEILEEFAGRIGSTAFEFARHPRASLAAAASAANAPAVSPPLDTDNPTGAKTMAKVYSSTMVDPDSVPRPGPAKSALRSTAEEFASNVVEGGKIGVIGKLNTEARDMVIEQLPESVKTRIEETPMVKEGALLLGPALALVLMEILPMLGAPRVAGEDYIRRAAMRGAVHAGSENAQAGIDEMQKLAEPLFAGYRMAGKVMAMEEISNAAKMAETKAATAMKALGDNPDLEEAIELDKAREKALRNGSGS